MNQDVEASFIRILLGDVVRADQAHQANPDQTAKRDFVRTTFAAIEGSVWIFREHIRGLALATGSLEEAERIALSETTYSVDKAGHISAQPKFLTLIATIRLCADIAERIAPASSIDFSAAGWGNLGEAIQVRNRITHPKALHDLVLSDQDIKSCANALHWFLEVSTGAMRETISVAREHVEGISDVLSDLKSGDEPTWEIYRSLMIDTRK